MHAHVYSCVCVFVRVRLCRRVGSQANGSNMCEQSTTSKGIFYDFRLRPAGLGGVGRAKEEGSK